MELYTKPLIDIKTYNQILDEISQQEINDAALSMAKNSEDNTKAFVFTVSGALTSGTYSAPTLEASRTEMVNELKARVRTPSTGEGGNDITITIKKNGVSIGTITIAEGDYTGTTIITDNISLIKNDQIDMDITDAGTGASDLSVFVRVK